MIITYTKPVADSIWRLLRSVERFVGRDSTSRGRYIVDLAFGDGQIVARVTDGYRAVRAAVAGDSERVDTVHVRIPRRRCDRAPKGVLRAQARMRTDRVPRRHKGYSSNASGRAALARGTIDRGAPAIDCAIDAAAKTWDRAIVVDRTELLRGARVFAVKANRKDRPELILSVGSCLTLSKCDEAQSRIAREGISRAIPTPLSIQTKASGSGVAARSGVWNAAYMVQALEAMHDRQVELRFSGAFDPLVIVGENTIHAVMPIGR